MIGHDNIVDVDVGPDMVEGLDSKNLRSSKIVILVHGKCTSANGRVVETRQWFIFDVGLF
jgi:hypothetical protein